MNEFEKFGTATTDHELRALDWDSEISQDAMEFPLLAPGNYPFTVDHVDKKQFDGSDKMPPCPMADVHLIVHAAEGDIPVMTRLFLHQKMEWKLSSFFVALGLKKKGEKLRMSWNQVAGKTGWAKISVREWKDKNGNERKNNDIQSFIDPDKAPKAATPSPSAVNSIPF